MFQRVESINKKSGPFEILLCVGDFFSEDSKQNEELIAYRNGHKHSEFTIKNQIIVFYCYMYVHMYVFIVSVPTYILGPTKENLSKNYENVVDGEICPNLTYLGRRGLYTLSNGTKIAYLSGIEKPSNAKDEEFYFQMSDIESVRNSCLVNKSVASDYRGIDILLTSQWPQGVKDNNVSKYSTSIQSFDNNFKFYFF